MLSSWSTSTVLLLSIVMSKSGAVILPFEAPDAGTLEAAGALPIDMTQRQQLQAAAVAGSFISRAGWTVTADSQNTGTGNDAAKVLDGNVGTFWQTQFSTAPPAPPPHTITVDMKTSYDVNGLAYLPRQDGSKNGNIGQHKIYVSADGITYRGPIAYGTYLDDQTQKITSFETVQARYLRIVAVTEAGGRGPWTSVAELNIYQAPPYAPPPNGFGRWGPTIDFPLVPVAAAVEHDTGRVLVWSAFRPDQYQNSNNGQTVTATWDPATQIVTQRTVTNTVHDMFCPGLSMDFNGRPVVTGGNGNPRTSIYDPVADAWTAGHLMITGRGYQSSVTVANGKTFTIGGSWSGGAFEKNGEIYDPVANNWTALPGCRVAPMLTADNDYRPYYRQDNHAWLFAWKSQNVFQAGPSKAMNWYPYTGTGGQRAAGLRGTDSDAMCGNAVMYDAVAGKILTVGGSTDYQASPATRNANIITLGAAGVNPTVTPINAMGYARVFANAVVLPDGKVFITGGQTFGQLFTDFNATLTPELWDPATNVFRKLLPNSIARTYHSVALLLLDGTVFTAGGGLCGTCSTNHFDAQIFTPPYLFNPDGSSATRPVITTVSASTVNVGGTLKVTTNSAIASMSLIRYGSATHTVDTDQRRIALNLVTTGTDTYNFIVPSDPGVAVPGYWMLFALNAAGVPSVAKTVKITPVA